VLALLTGDVDGRLAQGRLTEESAGRLRSLVRTSGQILVENGPDLVGIFVPAGAILARLGTMLARRLPWTERLEEMVRQKANQSAATPQALEQAHIFEQYTNVIRALSAQQQLVLILDDLHWADAGSLSLLFHLARRIGTSRVLIVGAYRPNDLALGRGGERHPLEPVLHEIQRYFGEVVLDLGQRPDLEGRAFIDALLDREPNRLDHAFRDALHRHTDGQPLFTVETLQNLVERGDLVRDADGAWTAAPTLSWQVIPARVEGVIEERIGRLEEELRDMLAVASVEGENFTAEVIARVQGLDDRGTIQRISSELERRHRLVGSKGIRRLGVRRLSLYRFQHNLFQKYLYTHLGEVERSYLHEDVGRELEQLYGERVEEIAVQLARHFEEAGIPEKAARYRLLAGEQARRGFANAEALEHFRRALERIDAAAPGAADPEWCHGARVRLHEQLGDILALTGRHAEAEVAFQEAASAFDPHDVVARARLQRKLASGVVA
jgi:predicted ATPase